MNCKYCGEPIMIGESWDNHPDGLSPVNFVCNDCFITKDLARFFHVKEKKDERHVLHRDEG